MAVGCDNPLGEVTRAVRRRAALPVIAGMVCALAAGGFDAMRPPIHECRAVVRVNLKAQMAALLRELEATTQGVAPSADRGRLGRRAEALVDLMGHRIMAKDQTFSQYLASHVVHALSWQAVGDAVLEEMEARFAKQFREAWGADCDITDTLRRQAIHVVRSKPANVLTLSFRAPDRDLARRGADALAAILIEQVRAEGERRHEALLAAARRRTAEAKQAVESHVARPSRARQSPTSAPVDLARIRREVLVDGYKSALACERHLGALGPPRVDPPIELLQAASRARQLSPRPLRTAGIAGLAGFLTLLLAVSIRKAPPLAGN